MANGALRVYESVRAERGKKEKGVACTGGLGALWEEWEGLVCHVTYLAHVRRAATGGDELLRDDDDGGGGGGGGCGGSGGGGCGGCGNGGGSGGCFAMLAACGFWR